MISLAGRDIAHAWSKFVFTGIGLGLLMWLLSRRRSEAATPKPRSRFDSEALAASMRSPAASVSPAFDAVMADDEVAAADKDADADVVPAREMGDKVEQLIDITDLSTTSAAHVEAPTWHSGRWVKAGAESDAAEPMASEPRFVPPLELPPEPASEPLPEPASAEQRMKLARAFLDIGDDHSAKQLLVELMDGADPAMRTDAAKLLRELG